MFSIALAILAFVSVPLTHADDITIQFKTQDAIYGAGEIIVPCKPETIDVDCKFDTGTNVSYFKSDAFQTPPVSIAQATFSSVNGDPVKCDFIQLDKAWLGGAVELENFQPIVCPDSVGNTKNNLIGLDALAGRAFNLDISAKAITFVDPATVYANTFDKDKVGHILMTAQSSKHTPLDVTVMFDTGATLSAIDMNLVKAQPADYTIINKVPMGTDSHGNPIEGALVMAGFVKVGNLILVAEYFMAMDFTQVQQQSGKNIQIILGFSAIKQAKWKINMQNSTWESN